MIMIIKLLIFLVLGDWSPWVYCKEGHKICGLRTRIDELSVFDDDAGMVDCHMYCCSYN